MLIHANDIYRTQRNLLLKASGTSVIDATAKNTLTINGGVTVSSAVQKFGMDMINFNGSTGSISMPNSGNFSLSGSDFTIWAHIYLTAYSSSYSGVFRSAICGSATNAATGWEFTVTGTSSSYTGLMFGIAGGNSVTASQTFALNTHYFVMLARSGNTYTFYVNGTALTTSGTAPTTWTDPGTFYVGRIQHPSFTYWFPGYQYDTSLIKAIVLPNVVPITPLSHY